MFPLPNLSTIDYNEENDFFIFKMKGNMNFEEYKNYFFTILKEIKKYNCRYWIYDLSEFESNSLKARMWQISVFLPKCFREFNQELVVAIIPPQSSMHKIAIKTAIKAIDKMNYPYELNYFTDIEKAKKWILTRK
ncbi:STAS/SEC14 domain-containing protein [Bernardetia sp. ABR2-2B]|uniref:STAS/SEC14 domain-containing protein n=1 Tax=Bernardetia sp. ABR2-2B TaxID=3127472 RepID=UPI0030CF0838